MEMVRKDTLEAHADHRKGVNSRHTKDKALITEQRLIVKRLL